VTAARVSPATAPATPAVTPELVWKRLARLLAAPGRSRMRLWDPSTEKFSDTAKRSDRLPRRPAALYLYSHGRTQLLWLDFDAKHHGEKAVAADVAKAAAWLRECGGVIITDRSTSGGRHLICPLAIGTSASRDEITQLVRLLAARLPTLDITPNTNPETGCLTPPGSPCREGGFRQLDGTLDAAIEALTTRSAAHLLPRLYMLLGALKTPPRQSSGPESGGSDSTVDTYLEGVGDDRRIAAAHQRHDPLPADVEAYATHGVRSRPTWPSNHEARMSVITQAIARGHSLDDLRAMIEPGGPWHQGLGNAYRRYRQAADHALERDFDKALDWLVTNVLKSSPPRHKTKNSQGGHRGPRGPEDLRRWLANALAWADQEFAGKRYRWTVHTVLQSLAFHAVMNGEHRSEAWLVGVGGRSLSLSAGLLSEDTVWRVLGDLRERPGAPIVLVRQHLGTEADVYALTSQNIVTEVAEQAQRVRIEPVHEAWSVLGHHLRRIHELVVHHGLRAKADIYAAARVARATGDAMIVELEIVGLLARPSRGTAAPGPLTLDDIADRHQLGHTRAERIHTYQEERRRWREWLAERERAREVSPAPPSAVRTAGHPAGAALSEPDDASQRLHQAWLSSLMATGPPDDPFEMERAAIDIIAEMLGGRIITA